jgi:hypothetical protein
MPLDPCPTMGVHQVTQNYSHDFLSSWPYSGQFRKPTRHHVYFIFVEVNGPRHCKLLLLNQKPLQNLCMTRYWKAVSIAYYSLWPNSNAFPLPQIGQEIRKFPEHSCLLNTFICTHGDRWVYWTGTGVLAMKREYIVLPESVHFLWFCISVPVKHVKCTCTFSL